LNYAQHNEITIPQKCRDIFKKNDPTNITYNDGNKHNEHL